MVAAVVWLHVHRILCSLNHSLNFGRILQMTVIQFTLLKCFLRRQYHKHICKMNQAYLRHITDSEKFELTFRYVDSNTRVDREFNFCRQATEDLNTFTQRVATNVEKVMKKKKKNQHENVQVSVMVNGNLLTDGTTLCKDIFSSSTDEVHLTICNQEYKVIINSPWIGALVMPTSILAGFVVYPVKFESVYMDKHSSVFCWHKSIDKSDWVFIGNGFTYNTKNSDIGNFLKLTCTPRNGNLEGPTVEVTSNVQLEAGPGFCPFQTRHQFTTNKCEGDMFRVMSYNILADLYCDSDFTREVLHPYCPHYALAIDYRKQLFVKEITGYNADIICLQEVDKKIYNYDLQPLFEELGYDSDFCLKSKQVAEGVACFFNKNRFKQLEVLRVILSDELSTNVLFSEIWKKVKENKQLSERILDRSSVLQVNVLESLDKDEILVVGNTHLYFHPDADHIRLLQGAVIIKYLESVLDKYKSKFQKRVSLILCGDFNSVPSCGIYELYTSGSVQEDHLDFESKPEEAIKIPLHQSLHLQSACGTPKYTNFTAGFADCLDYIYYEAQNLEVTQVVPFPSLEELNQHTALPSIVFPSDHIALVSDLKFK